MMHVHLGRRLTKSWEVGVSVTSQQKNNIKGVATGRKEIHTESSGINQPFVEKNCTVGDEDP